jgi:hypothetical protein
MTITEVIAELAQARADYGDLNVYISKDDEGNSITNYSDLGFHYDEDNDPDEETPVAVILYRGYEILPGHWGE